MVTLDTYLLAWRERDIRNAYLPFFRGDGLANYFTDPVFRQAVGGDPSCIPCAPSNISRRCSPTRHGPGPTWNGCGNGPSCRSSSRECCTLTTRGAVDHGAAGVIVSNHGGRQLDGAIAALDALPRVAEAVGDRMTVLFDSGIRRGSDVLKAIAMGARAVLLGRPYAYGLAVAGEHGVRDVLLNLIADLDLALGLTGCASLGELGAESLMPSAGSLIEPGKVREVRCDPSATRCWRASCTILMTPTSSGATPGARPLPGTQRHS